MAARMPRSREPEHRLTKTLDSQPDPSQCAIARLPFPACAGPSRSCPAATPSRTPAGVLRVGDSDRLRMRVEWAWS